MNRLPRYATNITGSNGYWHARQQYLQATFATRDYATVFLTLAAADTKWEDLHPLMPPRYSNTAADRRWAVVGNAHTFE